MYGVTPLEPFPAIVQPRKNVLIPFQDASDNVCLLPSVGLQLLQREVSGYLLPGFSQEMSVAL